MHHVIASRFCLGAVLVIAICGCAGPQTPIEPAARTNTAPAHSQAARAHVGSPCVYLLDTGEVSDLSNTHVEAPHCIFYINDTANMSYSTIKAATILYAGAPPKEMGARFPKATPAPGPVVSDPCPTIRSCAYLVQHPPATTGCSSGYYNGNAQIGKPGKVTCFAALSISGQNNTVCGILEIGTQLHLNNANVSACSSGVTFVMSGNADDTNFSSARLTFAPPRTGEYKGMLFYRVASQSASIDFSTCTCTLSGILYFPTTAVLYSSNSRGYQLLVFGQMNISATSKFRLGNPH